MKKRRKKCNIFLMAGMVLILAAFGLTGYNYYENAFSRKIQNEAIENMEKKIEEHDLPANPEAFAENPDMEMPTVLIDGQYYIGRVTIADVGLDTAIINQYTNSSLKAAPCRYAGSVYQDNIVIAGHNYVQSFGKLKNVVPGNEVVFTDVNGNEFLYKVSEIEVLNPEQVEEMKNGEGELTLFTCTASGKTRLTVRCTKEETKI